MNKENCKGCDFEEFVKLYVSDGGVGWASGESLPCTNCTRCPHPARSDNYRGWGHGTKHRKLGEPNLKAYKE